MLHFFSLQSRTYIVFFKSLIFLFQYFVPLLVISTMSAFFYIKVWFVLASTQAYYLTRYREYPIVHISKMDLWLNGCIHIKFSNKQFMEERRRQAIVVYSYFYVYRSIASALSDQIAYTYDKLPTYEMMSLFSATSYPFSFKFLISPFQQVYTWAPYGRKKFWIVLGGGLGSMLIILMSFFADQQQQLHLAIIMFFAQFMICSMGTQNDILALKQINQPETISIVQTYASIVGDFISSFVLIWLVSQKLGNMLGYQHKIFTLQAYLLVWGVVGVLAIVYVHFRVDQIKLSKEDQLQQQNVLQVISNFKVFFQIGNKYCRTAIFLIIYTLGIQVFESSFIAEAVRNGFEKEIETTIANVCLIPTLIILYFYSKYVNPNLRYYYVLIIVIIRFIIELSIFATNSYSLGIMIFYLFQKTLIDNILFLAQSEIMVSFPLVALSGMFMTALYSIRNLGLNNSPQLFIVGKMGFRMASIMGFYIQGFIIMLMFLMIPWIQAGEEFEPDEIVQDEDIKLPVEAID